MEYASVSSFGLQPKSAAVAIYYASADGQSNAGTRILFLIVQALEYFKDPFVILGVNADTIVTDGKGPFVSTEFGGDVDVG